MPIYVNNNKSSDQSGVIKIHADENNHRTCKDEGMKYRMKIFMALTHKIKDRADCDGYAAHYHEGDESFACFAAFENGNQTDNAEPAHNDIHKNLRHGKSLEIHKSQ